MNVLTPDTIITLFLLLSAALPPADTPPMDDITGYILRAKQQDREAIGILYQLHIRRIYRYIAARVGDAGDAEDLTAEVFVQMVQRISDYTITGAPFEAWLYRIASTQVAGYYRKRSMIVDDADLENVPDAGLNLDDLIQQEQGLDMLRDALRQLPDEHQTLLILRFVERKSHSEAAAIMGKSVTAVKSLQHRALVALTELMGSTVKQRHYFRGIRE